ncbi:MAG: HipA domain-containing protein [Candidatus Auribacterota bacterium]|nr:HipA domain-containing protein [Candidatus Auribacterota bacterium]
MTSDPSECYVYITLPGQVSPITAGRFTIVPNRQDVPTGKFVYGKSYLSRADAVPFDPIELKLTDTIFETTSLNGVFGCLRDAGPDYWGRRIIERHSGKIQLGEIDYLLYSPDDRAGALGFGLNQVPPAPKREFNQTLDLTKLQEIADAIISEDDISPENAEAQILDLMLACTSMGGARPKAVVEDNDSLWLAKFNRRDDKWNSARVEHSMLHLARSCGLKVAESRITTIGDRDVLLVKRFDREKTDGGYTRSRMISALTVLRSEDNHRSREKWSYVLLAEELRRICSNPAEDAKELFRRMVFNALISNTDDHPRNHAFIAKAVDWKLSPAYDLTPSALLSIERRDLAMVCGDFGRFANIENILSQSRRFLLKKEEAKEIVDSMVRQVQTHWYSTMRTAGVSERDCELLKIAFVYPGFLQSRKDDGH